MTRKTSLACCFLLSAAALLLAACQSSLASSPTPSQLSESVQSTPAPTPTATLLPEQSGVPLQPSGGSSAPPQSEMVPLHFTFPTPAPEAESLWRPPLYEVPWALGPYDHFYFTRPIAADQVNWPLANYRYGYIWEGATLVHTGIDIDAEDGTPVVAAGPGTVLWAGYGAFYNHDDPNDPYGQAVVIKHDFGFQGKIIYTVYAHMQRIDVIGGQHVQAGDQLGLVGSTGNSTGPHLHFEVRMEQNDYYATFNPELWLSPPQGDGVLAGTMLDEHGKLFTEVEITVTSLETGKTRTARTYGLLGVNGDPYYSENLVLADLPAGQYRLGLEITKEDRVLRSYTAQVTIHPGAITYFTFTDKVGFDASARPAVAQSSLWTDASNP